LIILAFGAVTVFAGNGEFSITCIMGSYFLWGVR
jgi:hypothetical protein